MQQSSISVLTEDQGYSHGLYNMDPFCQIQIQLRVCDDGDLVLMWPTCRLHFYVFTTVHGDQSVVAFAPSFL